MSKFLIEQSNRTPNIEGDSEEGTLFIKGKSLPEDARSFYLPFAEWLEELYETKSDTIKVSIELEYYNTSTSKMLMNLLMKLESLKATKKIEVDWRFDEDDLDMEETGHDFQKIIGDVLTMTPLKI
jgi:hypothetical protein